MLLQSYARRATLVVLWALAFSAAVAAKPPQPLRIVPGEYTIGPGGGSVRTICNLYEGGVPGADGQHHKYTYCAGDAMVARWSNGAAQGAPVPLSQVLQGQPGVRDPWLRAGEPRGFKSLPLHPVKAEAGVEYRITTSGDAVLWDQSAEDEAKTNDAWKAAILPTPIPYKELDQRLAKVGGSFAWSGFESELQDWRQDALWEPQTSGADQATLRYAKTAARLRVLSRRIEDPELMLAYLETCAGRRLLDGERTSAEALFAMSLPVDASAPHRWSARDAVHPVLVRRFAALGVVPSDFWTPTKSDVNTLIRLAIEMEGRIKGGEISNDGARDDWREMSRRLRNAGLVASSPEGQDIRGAASHTARFHRTETEALEVEYVRLENADGELGIGDLLFMKLPDNTAVIVDTGLNAKMMSNVIEHLQARQIKKVRVLITHPDRDHANLRAIEELTRSVTVETVLVSAAKARKSANPSLSGLLVPKSEAANAPTMATYGLMAPTKGLASQAGLFIFGRPGAQSQPFNRVRVAGDRFEVLECQVHPDVLLEVIRDRNATDKNEMSTVIRVTHNGVRQLLTGDLPHTVMADMCKPGSPVRDRLRADILKFPHHIEYKPNVAGWEKNVTDFLRAVDPARVILSNRGFKQALEKDDGSTVDKIEKLIRKVVPGSSVEPNHNTTKSQHTMTDRPTGAIALWPSTEGNLLLRIG